MNRDTEENSERVIEYEKNPEDEDFLMNREFDMLEKEMDRKIGKGYLKDREDLLDYYQMKRWCIVSEYSEEAMTSRHHRAFFFEKLHQILVMDISRVTKDFLMQKCPKDRTKYDRKVVLWSEPMGKVYSVVEKWYTSHFSSLYGTSVKYSMFTKNSGDGNTQDIIEEKEACWQECMCYWMCSTHMLFVMYCDRWFFDATKGKDIHTLSYLLRSSRDGGCLIKNNTPILKYRQDILVQSCDALMASLSEIVFGPDIERYIKLLKIRFVMLVTTKFDMVNGHKTLNMIDMIDKDHKTQSISCNRAFVTRIIQTLGNVDRAVKHHMYIVKTLGNSQLPGCIYNAPTLSRENFDRECRKYLNEGECETAETVSTVCGMVIEESFKEWTSSYLRGYRQQYILPRFRQQIYREWVRPGEYLTFVNKHPLREPNSRNIVSSLRPRTIDKMRPLVLTKKPDEVALSTQESPGMILSKNLASMLMLEYFVGENKALNIEWTDIYKGYQEVDVSEIRRSSMGEPCIIKTFCGYLVYCPWRDNTGIGASRKRSRSYSPKGTVYIFLRFHEAFHFWCMSVIADYKLIVAFSVKKYKDSATRTPKLISKRIREFYEVARKAVVFVYKGSGVVQSLNPKHVDPQDMVLWRSIFKEVSPFTFQTDASDKDYNALKTALKRHIRQISSSEKYTESTLQDLFPEIYCQ